MYFYDVKLNDKNHLVSTRASGVIVTITGSGDSIQEAMDVPMEIAARAKIPQKQYRTDLKEVFTKSWAELDRLIKREDASVSLAGVHN